MFLSTLSSLWRAYTISICNGSNLFSNFNSCRPNSICPLSMMSSKAWGSSFWMRVLKTVSWMIWNTWVVQCKNGTALSFCHPLAKRWKRVYSLKLKVTSMEGRLARMYTCYQEDMLLCLLLCSCGSRRWCSQKRWRTWGRTASTHPTSCCSSLPTTGIPIRRSQVMCCLWQTTFDKASKSNYCLQYSQSHGSNAQSVSARSRCALNRIIFSRWHHRHSEASSLLEFIISTVILPFSFSCEPSKS